MMWGSNNWRNIFRAFVVFYYLPLDLKEIITHGTRNDTFPMLLHKNISRMINNEKRMNHFERIVNSLCSAKSTSPLADDSWADDNF